MKRLSIDDALAKLGRLPVGDRHPFLMRLPKHTVAYITVLLTEVIERDKGGE